MFSIDVPFRYDWTCLVVCDRMMWEVLFIWVTCAFRNMEWMAWRGQETNNVAEMLKSAIYKEHTIQQRLLTSNGKPKRSEAPLTSAWKNGRENIMSCPDAIVWRHHASAWSYPSHGYVWFDEVISGSNSSRRQTVFWVNVGVALVVWEGQLVSTEFTLLSFLLNLFHI